MRRDLTFELKGLFGPYTLQVDGLRGWIVKTIRYRGEDRFEIPTEFGSGSGGTDLEVVLTNRPAQVLVRAFDVDGKLREDAQVVLFPADPRYWDATDVVRRGTKRDGVRAFGDLRPGAYIVTVLPDGMGVEPSRRLLQELAQGAERVTLVEGDQRTIDVLVRR